MEKYISEQNIANNDVYAIIKDSVTCPICQCLMIDIMECLKCQNVCCKNCLDGWRKKGGDCPNRCKSEFRKVIQSKNLIHKLIFKCINGCGAEIKFDDLKEHYSKCKQIQPCKNPRMTLIDRKRINSTKNNKKTKYFNRKLSKLILYSYYFRS